MDALAILTEAANALPKDEYDDDHFEVEHSLQPEKSNAEGIANNPAARLSLLRECAQQVTREERIESAAAFQEISKDIEEERVPIEEDVTRFMKNVQRHAEGYSDEDSADVDNAGAQSHNKKTNIIDEFDSEEDEGKADSALRNDPLVQGLKFACIHGDRKRVIQLLTDGTNPHVKDDHGWTLIHWAASKGFDDVMEEILRKVENQRKFVNCKDSLSGWTALHVACVGGHYSCAKSLLEHGADRTTTNKFGEKPFDCLNSALPNFKKIAVLLTGADPDRDESKFEEGE